MTHHHTTLGFEIEYTRSANVDDALANIRQAGNDNNKPALSNVYDDRHNYTTRFFTDRWVQGYDMSCGWEIKSHPLTDTSEVRDVMRGIRLAGGRVNNDCGLHVHVGIAHLSTAQHIRLAKVYARYEMALDILLPRSRRGTTDYATSNYMTIAALSNTTFGSDISGHFDNLDQCSTKHGVQQIANPRGKYSKMNLKAYNSKTTVEFRGHQGTLNFRKIDSWTSLLIAMLKIAEGTSEIKAQVATFSEMMDDLVGTEVRNAVVNRPGEGTKAAQVWDACDALFTSTTPDARFFAPSNVSASGFRVSNHGDLRALIMHNLGFAQGTTHVAITRWAQAHGLTARPSDSRTGLRSFLEGRATTLAN